MHNVYDDSRSVDIIYFDFQQAFDKVPHMRLLTKLKLVIFTSGSRTGYLSENKESLLMEPHLAGLESRVVFLRDLFSTFYFLDLCQ